MMREGGMYWSIVAVDATGTVLGGAIARDHGDVVRRAWARMLEAPSSSLPAAATELVLRDTRNKARDRRSVVRSAELGA